MKTGLFRSFKTKLSLKFFVLKKLLKAEKFIFMDFKKINKENGYAEGYFSAGFRDGQITGLMNIAQEIHMDNMKLDNMEDIVEEANQLIKSQ